MRAFALWRWFKQTVTVVLLMPLHAWLRLTMDRDADGTLLCDTLIAWWIEHPWKAWWPERYAELREHDRRRAEIRARGERIRAEVERASRP